MEKSIVLITMFRDTGFCKVNEYLQLKSCGH
uniref:Uncharacterized protein n=1 Tax=Arundo donax TaxID=35708 RepID=A0A0A9E1T1_ARUDO